MGGLGVAIGEYLRLGRYRVSSTVGAKPVETRFLEGSHFVKGIFGELEHDWQSHLRQWSHS